MSSPSSCGHRAEPGRRRCRDCRRRPGRARPSRTAKRPDGRGARASVYLALTEAEWVRLWVAQGCACYICRTPLRNRYAPGTGGQTAYVDHDHKLEKTAGLRASIRGLLCLWCNRRILVALHDNMDKAARAANYLQNPPARNLFGLDQLIALAARPDE